MTQLRKSHGGPTLAILAGIGFVAVGCGQADTRKDTARGKTNRSDEKIVQLADTTKVHDHNGWWCAEHGVPEEICGQCNDKVAAQLKKKGDWCKEHDRPDSQCFIHHPALKEKFAAQYRAKYGKDPPPMEEEAVTKKD